MCITLKKIQNLGVPWPLPALKMLRHWMKPTLDL